MSSRKTGDRPANGLHGMSTDPLQRDVTPLLQAAERSDRAAADQLLTLVYDQLRRAAQQMMQAESSGNTLSATALVHEAYLRLVGPRDIPWQGRAHFYQAAAQAMRRILIDRARTKSGRSPAARESRRRALEISGLASIRIDENPEGTLALDEALCRLEGVDAQAAAVLRLRFFAGLDIEQTAKVLGVSARTVKRDWSFARGWLREELER